MLAETYGIMVYQEQVMQTAQVPGGYSSGRRRHAAPCHGQEIGRGMAEHRAIFRKGAAENGISQEKADEVFDLMEKFAGLWLQPARSGLFPLAYHTGWLKVHYTAEFFCANMTVKWTHRQARLLFEDAVKRWGMSFEPPT